MNRLFWNARAIHGSGIMRSLVQVPIHYEYYEITGKNLTVKFWETILPYLNATLKDATQEMRERLSKTICLRQQNLLFLRSISSKKIASRPIMESALKSTASIPKHRPSSEIPTVLRVVRIHRECYRQTGYELKLILLSGPLLQCILINYRGWVQFWNSRMFKTWLRISRAAPKCLSVKPNLNALTAL